MAAAVMMSRWLGGLTMALVDRAGVGMPAMAGVVDLEVTGTPRYRSSGNG